MAGKKTAAIAAAAILAAGGFSYLGLRLAQPGPSGAPRVSAPPGKIMVIMLENHSAADATAQMPYLDSLGATFGQAADYHAVSHPSLPNYLVIFAGTAAGTSGDCTPGPGCEAAGPSLFGETVTAGETAVEYAEGMPSPCDPQNAGNYAQRHAVWPYFPAEAAQCQAGDLPMGTPSSGALASAIAAGTLPVTGAMIPDLCNDAHNCALSVADAWLQQWVPLLVSGPDWKAGNLTIIITFDEDDSANQVAFIAVSPALHGVVAQGTFDHCSLSRWLADNARVTELGCAAGAPDLAAAFGLTP